MEQKQVSPFEELHVMLLFGSDMPLTTVGEVVEQLATARRSLDISQVNQGLMTMTLHRVIEKAQGVTGGDGLEVVTLVSLYNHMVELCEIERLAIERDIIVMESFLMFMDAAAGTDRSAGERLQ